MGRKSTAPARVQRDAFGLSDTSITDGPAPTDSLHWCSLTEHHCNRRRAGPRRACTGADIPHSYGRTHAMRSARVPPELVCSAHPVHFS